MAFLSEAEEFLARLPSISLDGMDPLFPEADAVQARAQAEQQTAKVQARLGVATLPHVCHVCFLKIL